MLVTTLRYLHFKVIEEKNQLNDFATNVLKLSVL